MAAPQYLLPQDRTPKHPEPEWTPPTCRCSAEALTRRLCTPTQHAMNKSLAETHFISELGQTRLSTQSLAPPDTSLLSGLEDPRTPTRCGTSPYASLLSGLDDLCSPSRASASSGSLRRPRSHARSTTPTSLIDSFPNSTLRAVRRATGHDGPGGYLRSLQLKQPPHGSLPRRLSPIDLVDSMHGQGYDSMHLSSAAMSRGSALLGATGSSTRPVTTNSVSRPSLTHSASANGLAPRARKSPPARSPARRKQWTPLDCLHYGPPRSDDFYFPPTQRAQRERADEEHRAASKLQAMHRGHNSRKVVTGMKQRQTAVLGDLQDWLGAKRSR